ncbi:hypothetical protein [Christiangramia crocea]|uniref:Uncharacterized protein n=1 Tax=Christiangramia crocea TaxID=2904124 RepID=A0A9X2A6E2_9FLAO|nr:hypothetical protein [Gramella crocea]MCG9970921.1 hypothetical protein [Gramella crocea]
MNKVRIIGLGVIIVGFLTGYFSNESGAYIVSGMLIGLGTGWTITGKLHVRSKRKEITVESD